MTVVLSSSSWSLKINNLLELHNDPSSKWLSLAGGSSGSTKVYFKGLTNGCSETILRTWPEFDFLQHDIRSGKGRFVSTDAEAMAAIDASENEFYLTDTWTASHAVYESYIKGYHGAGGQLCKYSYTDKEMFNIILIFD